MPLRFLEKIQTLHDTGEVLWLLGARLLRSTEYGKTCFFDKQGGIFPKSLVSGKGEWARD